MADLDCQPRARRAFFDVSLLISSCLAALRNHAVRAWDPRCRCAIGNIGLLTMPEALSLPLTFLSRKQCSASRALSLCRLKSPSDMCSRSDSPLFLGHSTSFNSSRHIDPAIALTTPCVTYLGKRTMPGIYISP